VISLDPTDTIAAIGSPARGGVRGLVRVSGPEAFAIVFDGLLHPKAVPFRRLERRTGTLQVPGLTRPLSVEVSGWPGPKTYTGQPLIEVQTTGSTPVLQAVLATYLSRGARLAEPGEFTLRAFLSGRIDLTQAEAVLGVIDAHTPEQLDGALKQLAGGLASPIMSLRDDLADTLAHLEANLDFADEADVDLLGRSALASELARNGDKVANLAAKLGGRARATGRPRAVLVGAPNAGKSRLFNALIGRNQAIVSPTAGTTRDYLEAECECDGLLVDLVDTAGVDRSPTSIAGMAQQAQVGQARIADLLLDCRSGDSTDFELESTHDSPPRLTVWTKADLALPLAPDRFRSITIATTGEGLASLRSTIAQMIRSRATDGFGGGVESTAARCSEGLAAAARSLRSASEAVAADRGNELVAVDLRQAIDDLGRIVGAVVTDDLLDRIFRRFCIGK